MDEKDLEDTSLMLQHQKSPNKIKKKGNPKIFATSGTDDIDLDNGLLQQYEHVMNFGQASLNVI